ncbi:hypothetical protein B0H21DRAFT_755571 [Amylocystis lapponica]|nr:hypothetical protein B0H21DRAFT_755571 [Amylocystis lapponica]
MGAINGAPLLITGPSSRTSCCLSSHPYSRTVSMSQADYEQAQALNALIATKYNEMMLANFCAVAATTLLFYDYAVTFSREVKCIWGRKFTLATVLFLLNRYLTILNRILMVVDMLPWQSLPQATADKAAFTSLRMYAIWAKDWRVLVGVAFLGLVPPIVNIYYYTTLKIVSTPPPFVGCGEYVELSTLASDIYTVPVAYFNCVFAVASDAIVLILTWTKTWAIRKEFSRFKFVDVPTFSELLLRDGTTLFTLNVVNLVAIKYQAFGSIPALTGVLSSILISRFLLNLREVYLSGHGTDGSTTLPSKISTARFASAFAGNLGAPLQDAAFDSEETASEEEERAYISDDPLVVGLFDNSDLVLDLRHAESNDTKV